MFGNRMGFNNHDMIMGIGVGYNSGAFGGIQRDIHTYIYILYQ
jgi:hypothetical protein